MRGTWWIVFVFAAGAAVGARFSERSDAAPSSVSFADAPEPEPEARRHRRDLDCRDFASHREAQAFFEDNGPEEDPHRLDGDGDGVACERLW